MVISELSRSSSASIKPIKRRVVNNQLRSLNELRNSVAISSKVGFGEKFERNAFFSAPASMSLRVDVLMVVTVVMRRLIFDAANLNNPMALINSSPVVSVSAQSGVYPGAHSAICLIWW